MISYLECFKNAQIKIKRKIEKTISDKSGSVLKRMYDSVIV